MLLSGKVAVITGGAGDLGNAMALHLAQEGAAVSLWDIKSEAEAAPQIDRIKSATLNVQYQQVDIRDRVAVDAAFNTVMEQFGSLDIVCANAGIVEAAPFLEITPESWTRHIEINLTGSFHVGQQAARLMVRQGKGGRIIFTSTWVSAIPWPEITAYTASKGGLNMLMKQMARELAPHKILVNAIAPGIVKAGLAGRQLVEEPQYAARVAKVIPLGEPGTPEEIARAVVYLAGPHTAYMTGSILTLDGGCSLFQFDS